MSPPDPAAFISYSRAESDFALRLANDLKAAGARVWLDQIDTELIKDQDWSPITTPTASPVTAGL